MDEQSAVAHITAAICAYIRANPHAADSQDGITRWWLRDRIYSEALIRRALDELVKQGTLTRQTNPDGNVIYTSKQNL